MRSCKDSLPGKPALTFDSMERCDPRSPGHMHIATIPSVHRTGGSNPIGSQVSQTRSNPPGTERAADGTEKMK